MSSGLGSKTPGISCCFQFRDWLIFPKHSNVHRFKGVEQRAWRHSEGAWESCLLQDWKESWCLLRWRLNEISSWTYACLFCLLLCLCATEGRREAASWLRHACFSTWMLMLPLVVMCPLKHRINTFQNTQPTPAPMRGEEGPLGFTSGLR